MGEGLDVSAQANKSCRFSWSQASIWQEMFNKVTVVQLLKSEHVLFLILLLQNVLMKTDLRYPPPTVANLTILKSSAASYIYSSL